MLGYRVLTESDRNATQALTSLPDLCLCNRKKTERSKKFFTDLMAKEHVPTMINPKPCGHLCCCAITGCEEVKLRPQSQTQLFTRRQTDTNRTLHLILHIVTFTV